MAVKNWNGKTIRTEDGYLSEDAMKALRKRLAEKDAKAKNDAKKTEKKPTKKSK